ncbi:MAG: YHS domain-containing protein [Ilumatobacteraceae bacterium]
MAFVDLAGFTALTDVHGDRAAVDLLDAFVGAARDAVGGDDAELVKSIGDAVMIAATDPGGGLRTVRRLFEATRALDGFPEPRAGMHHGSVIERGGDYYGATVNLAARVAGRAGSSQAFATATMLDAAAEAGIGATSLGVQVLRNVASSVELWSLDLCPGDVDVFVDPVCRMRVATSAAAGRVQHGGVEHRFCSLACVAAFVAEPDRYARRAPS